MNDSIIETSDLSKIFNKGKPNEVDAVRSVSISIEKNQCTLIKGPSGSGKSTLLAIIGCLAKPISGSYLCLNQNVSRWSEKFLTTFRREHIGIIFQNFNLINGLTVAQNIALPLVPTDAPPSQINERVETVSEELQITHRLTFKVDTLSGGEMQRVAIARALINDPEIVIADEPTAHLDSDLAKDILVVFNQLKEAGKTILIATHDPIVEEHPMVNRVLCMRDGQLGETDVC